MTPDDLLTVQRSWAQLRMERAAIIDALTQRFTDTERPGFDASTRARWLVAAVDELVGLLAAPSSLATHARALGATWPDPHAAPSFAVEGRAWLAAAAGSLPWWSDETASAWRKAWLLLSDVLAAESLSPFADLGSTPAATDVGTAAFSPTPVTHASTTTPKQGPRT